MIAYQKVKPINQTVMSISADTVNSSFMTRSSSNRIAGVVNRKPDPFLGHVREVANFFASLFEEGYQYSSVNAYRSAI